MHYARIETSPMLKKIYAILKDRKWHTTFELMKATGCCTVSTRISELRQNGLAVECQLKNNERHIHEYRYEGRRV